MGASDWASGTGGLASSVRNPGKAKAKREEKTGAVMAKKIASQLDYESARRASQNKFSPEEMQAAILKFQEAT